MGNDAEQVEKLHTLARRYCEKRIRFWYDEYRRVPNDGRAPDGYHYSVDALNIFPRYLILEAILADIEALSPADDLKNLDDARELLCASGRTADRLLTRNTTNDISVAAISSEREAFCAYVTSSHDLDAEIEPLPFRRTLSAGEAHKMEAALAARWDPEKYDYPLERAGFPEPPSDAIAIREDAFDDEATQMRLRQALNSIGVTRVFEIGPEHEWKREYDLEALEPIYSGDESYWCDESLQWQIFVSHESVVSIAGDVLIDALRTEWPEIETARFAGWA